MTTIEDHERRISALEMDMPTRRAYAAHLHDLDTKFQRLEEGQQRLEHGLRALEHKVDGGFQQVDERFQRVDERFQRLEDKLDILLAESKINLD